MANSVYGSPNLKGVQVNSNGNTSAGSSATFDSAGYAEFDSADTDLVTAVTAQGAQLLDKEGTEEALTAGVKQTATTLSALVIRNGAGATVLNVRETNGSGTIRVGPITIAANAERVIVFPTQLTAIGTGVFVEVVSGALNATPGFLLP